MSSPSQIRSPLPVGGRVHRVGKLRAGVKKQGSRDGRAVEYPSAVDYFVVNADASTSVQSAESFHRVYGDEPRELRVVLPGETPEDVLQGAWRMYGTGGLLKRKCVGPGRNCVERTGNGEWVEGPCACAREGIPVTDKKRHCQARWTLSVLLMDVSGLGVWQFDTGSVMAAEGLASMLQLIHAWRGTLLRMECTLRLAPRQVAPEGRAKTVYIAVLDAADMTPAKMLASVEDGGMALGQLPPPVLDEMPDELLDPGYVDDDPAKEYVAVMGEVLTEQGRPYAVLAGITDAFDATEEIPLGGVEMPSVGEQLKAMSLHSRAEFYELAGIPKGSKASVVRDLILKVWEQLELPPFLVEPDLMLLLSKLRKNFRASTDTSTSVESFQHFADTGEEIAPGDQTSMYGDGAPA